MPRPYWSPLRVALAVFLLTSAAATAFGWYFINEILPTRQWWVKEDPAAYSKDPLGSGRYFEKILASRLSTPKKLELLARFAGRIGTPARLTEASTLDISRALSPTGSREMWEPTDRYRFLRERFVALLVEALADAGLPEPAHTQALELLCGAAELASYRVYDSKDFAVWQTNSDRGDARRQIAKATPVLVRYLTSPFVDHRRYAAEAFARIGLPARDNFSGNEVVEEQVYPAAELIGALGDADAQVREQAATALGYPPDRNRAAETLGTTPERDRPAAITALLAAFSKERDHRVRLAIVRGLGLTGSHFAGYPKTPGTPDARPALVAFLNSPPVVNDKSVRYSEYSPEEEDNVLRAEVIVALALQDPTPEATAAVGRILADPPKGAPEPHFSLVLVAAWAVGGQNGNTPWHSPNQGAQVLAAFRREWERLHTDGQMIGVTNSPNHYYRLFTFTHAILHYPETARTVVSDLVRIVPVSTSENHAYRFKPDVFLALHARSFPRPRPNLWSLDGNRVYPLDWLTKGLEKIGPPAKSELPALMKLLEYDGKPDTTDLEAIDLVRSEAAKAVIRSRLEGVKDTRGVLTAIINNPLSQKALVQEAEARLKASQMPK